MHKSLFDECKKAVVAAMLNALIKDPLRGIMPLPARKKFHDSVRHDINQAGYAAQVTVELRGARPSVHITIGDVISSSYQVAFTLEELCEAVDLGHCARILSN